MATARAATPDDQPTPEALPCQLTDKSTGFRPTASHLGGQYHQLSATLRVRVLLASAGFGEGCSVYASTLRARSAICLHQRNSCGIDGQLGSANNGSPSATTSKRQASWLAMGRSKSLTKTADPCNTLHGGAKDIEWMATPAGARREREPKATDAEELRSEPSGGEEGTEEKGNPDMGPDCERRRACSVVERRGEELPPMSGHPGIHLIKVRLTRARSLKERVQSGQLYPIVACVEPQCGDNQPNYPNVPRRQHGPHCEGCALEDWPRLGWSVTEKRDQTFPHLDVVLSGERGGELWVVNPEVASGPRGSTEEEEEPRRLRSNLRGPGPHHSSWPGAPPFFGAPPLKPPRFGPPTRCFCPDTAHPSDPPETPEEPLEDPPLPPPPGDPAGNTPALKPPTPQGEVKL